MVVSSSTHPCLSHGRISAHRALEPGRRSRGLDDQSAIYLVAGWKMVWPIVSIQSRECRASFSRDRFRGRLLVVWKCTRGWKIYFTVLILAGRGRSQNGQSRWLPSLGSVARSPAIFVDRSVRVIWFPQAKDVAFIYFVRTTENVVSTAKCLMECLLSGK
jgi:hypothetical protein